MTKACWTVPGSQLVDLTPIRARDLVVECFLFAQRETLIRAKLKVGASGMDDAAIRASIVGAVRLAFKESGGEYDRPTVASLTSAIAVLARKAEAWGTPIDIIQHHHDQILNLLQRMSSEA